MVLTMELITFQRKFGDKEKIMVTEEKLMEALVDLYESEFKDEQTFEEFADMLDFWIDKDGSILIEGRGMKPVEGVKEVGHVDNGVVYAY